MGVEIYRTYRFLDKDPVIDKVRTILQDEGLIKKLRLVHELSGVSTTCLDNWFNGETRRPQHATIAAVVTSLGYEETFVRKDSKPLDIERERKKAADWLLKQTAKKTTPKRRVASNGHANKRGIHDNPANRNVKQPEEAQARQPAQRRQRGR